MDNGVRNALISQFNALADRNDAGPLFENFVLMERLKKQAYEDYYGNRYFWRTYDQQQIDLIEQVDGTLAAFECKFSQRSVKPPRDWAKHYPQASWQVIHQENYLEFVV
ncbi:MAG: DUF4143 domain-containing protein [SAR324 cluster bacterium]|nr:DUF4143 domain-containing protein [SAR324 cluster bacterium]